MDAHNLRARIYALELDIETLRRDPIRYQKDIAVLSDEVGRLRRRLGAETGHEYPMALDLCFHAQKVRVIVDNQWEAQRIERAWLKTHPGGGSMQQRASYSAWAQPLIASIHEQQAAQTARRTA